MEDKYLMNQLNYYVITSIISAVTVIVAVMHVQENDLIYKVAKKRFKSVAYWLLAEIAITSVFTILEGNTYIASGLLYILKASELCIYPIICLNVIKIFKAKKAIKNGIMVFTVANAFIQIVSILSNKFMFFIDYNNIYNRTSYSAVYVVAIFACVLLVMWNIYIYSRCRQNLNRLTLWGIMLIFLIGFCIKILVRKSNFDTLCCSIAFWILITYYFNIQLRLNPLTKLLDRRVYESFIREINYNTIVFVIDANHFKQINDSLGHKSGDETLKALATCIIKAYGDYAYCFRTGGDEFTIILKPNVLERLIATRHYCPSEIAQGFMQKLDDHIEAQKSSPLLRKFGVSQGWCYYKKNTPFKDAFRTADARMYSAKQEKHAKM